MEKTLDWDNFTGRICRYIEGITYEPALRRPGSGSGPGKMPDQLRAYVESLDDHVRRNVLEILALTATRAPAQLHSVVTLIVRHSIEVSNLAATKESIARQIEFERDRDLSDCLYQRPPLRPEFQLVQV
jgi:hypothetical protein